MDNAPKKDEIEEEDIYSEIGDGYESDWELNFVKNTIYL